MKITVRYFAGLREQRGKESEELSVPVASCVRELYDRLFPDNAVGRLPVMYAVNHAYVTGDHELLEGDEVALIPPLGGG